MDTWRWWDLWRGVSLIHACLFWNFSEAEASHCTERQIDKCHQAAVDRELPKLSGGGRCEPSKYVEYTHVCSVTNYLTNPDYCCCAYEHKVLCCRYHYDWNVFRCKESEDTIFAEATAEEWLPKEVMYPVIIVPSVVLFCLIVYCIKCCCCNDDDYDDDDDDERCCKITCRRKKKRKEKIAATTDACNSLLVTRSFQDTCAQRGAPALSSSSSHQGQNSTPYYPLHPQLETRDSSCGPWAVPSAPPVDDIQIRPSEGQGLEKDSRDPSMAAGSEHSSRMGAAPFSPQDDMIVPPNIHPLGPPPAYAPAIPQACDTFLYYRPQDVGGDDTGAKICVMTIPNGEVGACIIPKPGDINPDLNGTAFIPVTKR